MSQPQKIEVHIKEVEKGEQGLTLFNFRDELVNFMYKKTVADSTRLSMRFYILIFFLSLQIEKKTLLRKLLEENIEKLEQLNAIFEKKGKLKKNEYTELVKEAGLTEVFRSDIFFLLLMSIIEADEVIKRYDTYFKNQKEIKKEFLDIVGDYQEKLIKFRDAFVLHSIADDRVDDLGNHLDLSKSVYRTIQMRTSRQLDLTLHKYADLKEVKSRSPIDLTIIQQIDFRIIIDLWEIYDLGGFAKNIWDVGADFGVQPYLAVKGIGYVSKKWLNWKAVDGKKNRKEKKKAKTEFQEELKNNQSKKDLVGLSTILAESVIKSNEFLQAEIKSLKEQIQKLNESRTVLNKTLRDKKIDELEKRVKKLENIRVKATKKKK